MARCFTDWLKHFDTYGELSTLNDQNVRLEIVFEVNVTGQLWEVVIFPLVREVEPSFTGGCEIECLPTTYIC